ncbi:prolyl-tRNA synthetase associated domain-containing protein [Apilactobacillus ozensis]|uniref:prolyl-tRNA synthetase associated domain-containing protein n=1 Tax=Apilactobacillus ozensis TaxID=866801 RepID=UPI00200A8A24|nr:prolyl-tRNA synthetase associated domain-containing protein [Apilactobacillus ozensis]MCK8607687.1 prolyl-tRNA synthetase associated domain-containing protein [Apilactobacillus ozensis]
MNQEEKVFNLLEQNHINYDVIHHPAAHTVSDIHFDFVGSKVKNLLLKSKNDNYYLLIIDSEKKADIKNITKQLAEKKMSFAKSDDLFNLMNLQPGSVTPFGLINDKQNMVKVLIDSHLDKKASIGFHPNVNTQTIVISFADFIKSLEIMGNSYAFIDAHYS